MPDLTSFPALRFSPAAGDLSALLAPPYDVIDAEDAADLRSRSQHNCVRLILPEGSTEDRYVHASQTLAEWIRTGVLAPDPRPSVYVYRQDFPSDAGPSTRFALFAAVRLTPFADGDILPHEHTHSGPKKDRLALTLATRTQLSPIFMVARDEDGALYDLELAAADGPPAVEATTPDGVHHALWVVTDELRDRLLKSAGSDPLLIADGHHRYETALVARESLGDSVKAAYLLVCIVSQRDPGLVVRPTHRILSRPPDGSAASFDWCDALSDAFTIENMGDLDPEAAERAVAGSSPGALLLAPAESADRWLARARPEALLAASIPPERARIAPVVFNDLVLKRLYGLGPDEAAHEGILSYSRGPGDAAAPPEGGCGFVLPAVSLEDVWSTASLGGRLPPKSTYFEPKMPSGLLFRQL